MPTSADGPVTRREQAGESSLTDGEKAKKEGKREVSKRWRREIE